MNGLPSEAPAMAPEAVDNEGLLPFDASSTRDLPVGIRPFRQEDVPSLFEATSESIDDLCRWMVWCHPGYTLKECEAFVAACDTNWDRGESYSFVIFDPRDGAFLGSAGLNQINHAHRVANLGYWVRRSRAGRGIATSAARLVARFALRELGFNRLDVLVPLGNRASQHVARKAGAKEEGILRNRLVIDGKSHDAILYSMVAEDLERQADSTEEVTNNLF